MFSANTHSVVSVGQLRSRFSIASIPTTTDFFWFLFNVSPTFIWVILVENRTITQWSVPNCKQMALFHVSLPTNQGPPAPASTITKIHQPKVEVTTSCWISRTCSSNRAQAYKALWRRQRDWMVYWTRSLSTMLWSESPACCPRCGMSMSHWRSQRYKQLLRASNTLTTSLKSHWTQPKMLSLCAYDLSKISLIH